MNKEFESVMHRAWMRDHNNQIYTGEALVLAMLLKVKKRKRTLTDENELREILEK